MFPFAVPPGTPSSLLTVRNLTVSAPPHSREDALVKNLSLKIESGQHILVIGQSSSGKTSLLRTLRGLWPSDSGELLIGPNANRGFFFLPQNVYLAEGGSLAEQVMYPLAQILSLSEERNLEEEIVYLGEKIKLRC